MQRIEGLKRHPIITVAGTRPEVIKLSQLVLSLPESENLYLYTGQHYTYNMRDLFFHEFGRSPDVDLACNTSDVTVLTDKIEEVVEKVDPVLVVVYGDTNSTLAASFAAKRHHKKLLHLEAGLRSFDNRMPEEYNRKRTDQLSDYLFCPSDLSKSFLKYEHIVQNVSVPGNLIVDVCSKYASYHVPRSDAMQGDFALLTIHRAENVDNPEILNILMQKLEQIESTVVFPIHPRTLKNIEANAITLPPNVKPIDPVGYFEFLGFLRMCSLVITDSGGVQEEAIILGKPCITLRQTTERWETILMGGNILFPLQKDNTQDLGKVADEMRQKVLTGHPYGEDVTRRTVNSIREILEREHPRLAKSRQLL